MLGALGNGPAGTRCQSRDLAALRLRAVRLEGWRGVSALTHNERQRVLRLMRQMREANANFYLRLNDTDRRSTRARTLAAKKLMQASRRLWLTVRRT
jgi:hypothetical protein